MGGKKRRGSSKPPSDYQGKKEAVEQFRLGRATAQQKTWLKSQGVDLRKTASKQHSVLSEILVQAQIEVVEAMRSERKRTKLSADDKDFLETEGINPEIPAADQEVRIEKLLDKLEKDEVRAQTDMLQAQIDKKQAQIDKKRAQIDKTQAQINVVKAMRSEGKRTNLSADDRVFLETEGINPEIPAADQAVRIEKLLDKLEKDEVRAQTDMLQAQFDKTQAQINVVKAMRSERKRTNFSADDKEFLKTEGINPEIPAADQAVRIEKLLDKLEKEKPAVC